MYCDDKKAVVEIRTHDLLIRKRVCYTTPQRPTLLGLYSTQLQDILQEIYFLRSLIMIQTSILYLITIIVFLTGNEQFSSVTLSQLSVP